MDERRTESVEGVFSLSPPIEKLIFCCHVVTEEGKKLIDKDLCV